MKKLNLRWLNRPAVFASMAVLLVLAAGAPLAAQQLADTQPTAVVSTGRLNMRTGPGIGYTIIMTLTQGDDLEMLGRTGDQSWLYVRWVDGTEGWVSSGYVSSMSTYGGLPVMAEAGEPAGMVATGWLNMRTGPGTMYPIIHTLAQNTMLSELGLSPDGNWMLVRASGLVGWVNAGFIESGVLIISLNKLDPAQQAVSPPAGPVPFYDTGIANTPTLDVHAEPLITSPITMTLPSGTRFRLTGRDETGGWVQIMLMDGSATGWVNANNIGAGIPLGDLPVVTTEVYG